MERRLAEGKLTRFKNGFRVLVDLNEIDSLLRGDHQLGRLEQQIADLLEAPVDLVPESGLRHDLRERVQSEAVTL